MVEDVTLMKKNESLVKNLNYEVDLNMMYKMECGAGQITNDNYEMEIAVADKFTNTHIPITKDTTDKINSLNYARNKQIREERRKENTREK